MTTQETVKAMVSMSKLAKVRECLQFLADENIVKQEAVFKGVKKFVADHPEIQAAFDKVAKQYEDAAVDKLFQAAQTNARNQV